ncbi:MAG: family 78 glycoside hydrolase catalytic domain [Verrucomicrobiia bacterium]
MKRFCLLPASILFLAVFSGVAMTVGNLSCEHCVNPLGIDLSQPRLSWVLQSSQRGDGQSAYQVLVASSRALLDKNTGDLWDSGKVDLDETIQIAYAGSELKSSQQVFWKVRAWDVSGIVSAWSKPATWTMGLLSTNDWQARWIGAADTNIPSLLLRHEFVVKPGLKRALVDVCGLGQYELTLDGKKVGDDFLSPGWTKYDKTCLYDTRDITDLLREGKNAAGIELGNGMYNIPATRFKPPGYQPYSFGPLKAIALIRLEYADGSVETVGTDESWRAAPGPIASSSIYSGEDFDARLVQQGWNKVNFNDSKWLPAIAVNGPGGELRGISRAAPPIREYEIHKPVLSRTLTNGDVIFDLGQNASHIPKISVSGPAGSKVRIIPSELTNSYGSANQGSMGASRAAIWCDFTKATDGVETWSPKFFYIGCRYFEVKFFPARDGTKLPAVKSIEGIVVQSSSEPIGEFECSSTLFNRIHNLVRRAQRSNMMSVMTDCPQREKRGWLEEDHLNGPALRYEFGLAQLFTKMMNDMADSQLTNGLVPTTAPEYTIFGNRGAANNSRGIFGDSPEWGSAFILVPWQQYEFDGDLNLFRTHYDAITNYLAYLGSRADNGIVNYGLGDWYDVGPKNPGVAQLTPIALTATAFYFQDVEIMSRAAALLGKTNDANQFSGLAEKIRRAFNEKFYNPTNRFYATDSQCANSIPLVMGICEPTNRAAVTDALVADVRSRGNALTAGDIGYRYLLRALADGGRSDVIFDINNQSGKPGYGMQLKKGATSLTEAWDAGRNSSQNHFMLGQIMEWFYADLAGIATDPSGPGFKKIVIRPAIVGDLTWVKGRFDSVRGPITTGWRRESDRLILEITIPPSTTATVFVPAQRAEDVTEGGIAALTSPHARFLRQEKGNAVFEIDSGKYQFSVSPDKS